MATIIKPPALIDAITVLDTVLMPDPYLVAQRAFERYRATAAYWMPWINRLELYYPAKFLVKPDTIGPNCWVRVGMSATEVGMHYLKENGYFDLTIWA